MITISSYRDSNSGLWIDFIYADIYFKVHSDNHYTIRANKTPGTTIFLSWEILKPLCCVMCGSNARGFFTTRLTRFV